MTPDTRVHVHRMIDSLPPAQLAAVETLLEAFLDEGDSDTLSPAEARAIAEADEWSKRNEPIPNEEVLAEFGLTVSSWEKMSVEP